MENKTYLEGIISSMPALKKNEKDVSYIFFTIENNIDGSKHSNLIDCMAWGNTAEFIAMNINEGQQIAVSGKLMTMPQTGNRNKTTYIRVDNAYLEVQNESTPINLVEDSNDADEEMPF